MEGFSFAKVWTYTQITYNDSDDFGCTIDGDTLVWNGRNEQGKYRLLTDSLNEGVISEILTGDVNGHWGYPSMHNGQLAFRVYDWKDTQSIYVWENGNMQRIYEYKNDPDTFPPYWGYPPSYASLEPQIHNGQVAFAAYDGNDYEIFSWKDGNLQQITNNDFDDYEAQIHDGKITWTGWGGDKNTKEDVFLWEGANIINVSQSHQGTDEDSNIWGNKIVWTGRAYDHDDPLFDIYIAENGVMEHVHYMEGNDFEPVVYDNLVAWANKKDGHPYETYVCDGYNVSRLDVGLYDTLGPSIYEDKLIFNAYDGNDYEIFLARYTTGYTCQDNFSGHAREIVVSENIAYVAHGSGGLKIFDVSDPSQPSEIGHLSSDTEIFDVVKKGMMTRSEALTRLETEDIVPEAVVNSVLSDLGLTAAELKLSGPASQTYTM